MRLHSPSRTSSSGDRDVVKDVRDIVGSLGTRRRIQNLTVVSFSLISQIPATAAKAIDPLAEPDFHFRTEAGAR